MSRLLCLLSWLHLTLALLLPLGLWAVQHLPSRGDLHWARIGGWNQSDLDPGPVEFAYGGTIHLDNRGTAPIEEIRILLPLAPADMETFLPDGTTLSMTPAADGRALLTLGPLPADQWADLRIWGASDPLELTADGEPVSEGRLLRPHFREEPWLPNWAIGSLILLALGLFLQNVRRTP